MPVGTDLDLKGFARNTPQAGGATEMCSLKFQELKPSRRVKKTVS
jgi:hypothetical protein